MPPLAISETRTSSTYSPASSIGFGGVLYSCEGETTSTPMSGEKGIWLPGGGQTSPVSQEASCALSVETPLDAVRKRVCADAFRAVEELRLKDGPVTPGQLRLAHSLLVSLRNRIMEEPSSYVQFSPVRVGVMEDGEIVLEWFYDTGRIQFFIDAELGDSTVVFLDAVDGHPLPKVEDFPISTSNANEVAERAVEFAMEHA